MSLGWYQLNSVQDIHSIKLVTIFSHAYPYANAILTAIYIYLIIIVRLNRSLHQWRSVILVSFPNIEAFFFTYRIVPMLLFSPRIYCFGLNKLHKQ